MTSAANGFVLGIWQLGENTKNPFLTVWLSAGDDWIDSDDDDDDDGGDCEDDDNDALNRIDEKFVDMFDCECNSRVFVETINGITFWCKSSAETVFLNFAHQFCCWICLVLFDIFFFLFIQISTFQQIITNSFFLINQIQYSTENNSDIWVQDCGKSL